MGTLARHFYPEDGAATPRRDRCWRYNRRSLEFLEEQLEFLEEQLERTASLPNLSDVLKEAAKGGTPQQVNYQKLAKAMRIRRALIIHHTRAFNAKKFFTTREAQCGIELICRALNVFLATFDLHIQDTVPPACVDNDKRTLEEFLGYVLGLHNHNFDGVSATVVQEWTDCREAHCQQLTRFTIIEDDDVKKPQHLHGALYKCSWRGREYSMKDPAVDNEEGTVQLVRTYAEAACMASIRSASVVNLYCMTRAGKLVMKLGEADLMTWLEYNKPVDLMSKLHFLKQAGVGLADVHYQGFVHCSVSPKSFIVFDGREVKISGFYSMVASSFATCTTNINDDDAWWAAPEIFDGAKHTPGSDIYSFGVVMYAVIADSQPYGGNSSAAAVHELKKDGQPPCDLQVNCTGNLANLMSDCCSADPAKRPPSMDDVWTHLDRIIEDLKVNEGSSCTKSDQVHPLV